MQSIQLLKTLINITYYILLVGLFFYPLFMIYGLFDDGVGVLVTDGGNSTYLEIMDDEYESGGLEAKDYMVLILSFVKSLVFFLAIHYLRKAVIRMIDITMYDNLISKSLGLTGNYIIVYAIFNSLYEVFKSAIYTGEVTIGLNFDAFNSFVFLIILGLVFLLMSKVIKRGVQLKQENELTI